MCSLIRMSEEDKKRHNVGSIVRPDEFKDTHHHGTIDKHRMLGWAYRAIFEYASAHRVGSSHDKLW